MSHVQNVFPTEGQPISSVVSLNEAGRQLGLNPHFVKGVAVGLGIDIQPAGRCLIITRKDLERIRRATQRGRQPRQPVLSR